MKPRSLTTEHMQITGWECQRNDAKGMMSRWVYVAFLRDHDIPKPVCVMTVNEHSLGGTRDYVEWLEVVPDMRRQGLATELVKAVSEVYGGLYMDAATDEGRAFIEAYDKGGT